MFVAQGNPRNNPLISKIFNFQRAESIFMRVLSHIFQDGLIKNWKKGPSRLEQIRRLNKKGMIDEPEFLALKKVFHKSC